MKHFYQEGSGGTKSSVRRVVRLDTTIRTPGNLETLHNGQIEGDYELNGVRPLISPRLGLAMTFTVDSDARKFGRVGLCSILHKF